MDTSHLLLLLLMYLHVYAKGCNNSCLYVLPDSSGKIPVEVGKNFTAVCHVRKGCNYSSDDIEWKMGKDTISKELYIINQTSVSVTVDVSSRMHDWLTCVATGKSLPYIPTCVYGIYLDPGNPPSKPTNLSCIAFQNDPIEPKEVSPNLTCFWNPGPQDPKTIYTLHAEVYEERSYKRVCETNLARSCTVNLSTFPVHMHLKVWVEVQNALGSERSEVLSRSSANFVKPNPPLDITILPEVNLPTSLLVIWDSPIEEFSISLGFFIRYCQAGSSVWVEETETIEQNSFRLQDLNPYTEYVVQMRSIGNPEKTYWSDWSANVTARTAEAKPASPPDLWRIIKPSSENRNVTVIWKPPVKANGKILKYSLFVRKDSRTFERHLAKTDDLYQMYSMELLPEESVIVQITANNSAGESPNATLFISRSGLELPGVKNMKWQVRDGKLQVEWSTDPLPKGIRISEYLLEWQNEKDPHPHWQRLPPSASNATINGDLTKFKRYNISVSPIYKHFQAGKTETRPAYAQQGSPEKGPIISDARSKKNSAELTWEEIPLDARCGFIQNYTIFYKAGNTDKWQSVTVEADIHSHVLTDLLSEMDYVVRIMASTEAGSTNGTDFTFKTMKYGDGEVELIVVVVCLSFLFLSVFIIMLCLRKREVIKKLLWPQVPDPSDSSIAHWSPDFPVKADMPKEDVSVVEVDVFDGKSLCEEDKGMLPLKKDKYLSEEHSSGIGGSSCMSSPRHSVSDSDEGDSGQTTASTVQYSSVVASGYKGQTPNHQPPAFARSESTQPLLDCEEHPDHLSESAGHCRSAYFRRGRELEPAVLVQECDEPNEGSLTFCPAQEEEASPAVEDPSTALSYMPQQSGYRPQ